MFKVAEKSESGGLEEYSSKPPLSDFSATLNIQKSSYSFSPSVLLKQEKAILHIPLPCLSLIAKDF